MEEVIKDPLSKHYGHLWYKEEVMRRSVEGHKGRMYKPKGQIEKTPIAAPSPSVSVRCSCGNENLQNVQKLVADNGRFVECPYKSHRRNEARDKC